MMRLLISYRAVLLSTVVLGLSPFASSTRGFAQTSAAIAPSSADLETKTSLEEIIVTAQRKEENLQTVPMVITVVSQQKLEQNNVQTIEDLQYLVPSMTSISTFSRDSSILSIRGQEPSETSSIQAVVTYLNDVPVPTTVSGGVAGGPGMMFDLSNVQVLKGPQGTLFGRNSTGGAVLFDTTRPKDGFGGSLQVTYGNYDDRESTGVLNLPLIGDTLITRIAFAEQDRDGFSRVPTPNYPNGIDADDRHFYAFRDTMSFHPNDTLQDDLIVSYDNYWNHGSPNFIIAASPNGLANLLSRGGYEADFIEQQALGPRVNIGSNTPLVSQGTDLAVQNISSVQLPADLTFRNIFGFDHANTTLAQDFDGSPYPLASVFGSPNPFPDTQYTEEAQLLGKSFDEKLDWIVGGFYLHNHNTYVDGYQVFFLPTSNQYASDRQSSKAIYGQATYDFSSIIPKLKFTAGARYTWDNEANQAQACPAALGLGTGIFSNPACSPVPASTFHAAYDALTWNLALNYQLDPDTLLYVSGRRGYRAGSFNTGAAYAQFPQFGPEFVTDAEIGVKSDFTVGGVPVRLDAAAYHDDYSQIQVTQYFGVVPNLLIYIGNEGDARVWGTELEATVELTKALQVGATFDYLNFRYTSFGAAVTTSALAIAGETTDRPPEKYSLNARYKLLSTPELGDVSASATWAWQATSAFQIVSAPDINLPGSHVPSFGLLNVSADWHSMYGKPFDLSFFMSNALDKLYIMGGITLMTEAGFAVAKYGEPRMFGFRLKYHFGTE
jgi:iron complex outermembrane receptor protein